MSYRAIYAYAWDIAETGVRSAVDEFRGLGLNTVTIAGSYHAGKFLRPHGMNGQGLFSRGRHRLLQDGPTSATAPSSRLPIRCSPNATCCAN